MTAAIETRPADIWSVKGIGEIIAAKKIAGGAA
jgi:hypothetical protein